MPLGLHVGSQLVHDHKAGDLMINIYVNESMTVLKGEKHFQLNVNCLATFESKINQSFVVGIVKDQRWSCSVKFNNN